MQTDFRIAKREALVGGKAIRRGEGVILLTGSANRDEAAFGDPVRLDIARKGPRHAAFGRGAPPRGAADGVVRIAFATRSRRYEWFGVGHGVRRPPGHLVPMPSRRPSRLRFPF